MELNRDLAVCALQAYQRLMKHELVACEPLSGCGVRGIRLAKEVEGVRKIVVNDISSDAARLAESNANMNGLGDKVAVCNKDANFLLSSYAAPRKRFDYIDLDPFGSPVPYIDSALRALRNGGLLALTATDMAPLCGVHVKACLRKYGGRPLRTDYCHELAVRLLIGCLGMLAAKHDIGVSPVFSYSDYNYVRTYATTSFGAKKADNSVQEMGYILHCFSCFHRESQLELTTVLRRDCPECGSKLHVAGPLWLGQLWDERFCALLDSEAKRKDARNKIKILRLLSLITKEMHSPITYYAIDKLCDKFNLPVPPLSKVIDQLSARGFQGVATHFSSKAVRTDAPATVLKDMLVGWAKISGS
jgi:tRNA (guanine26-N2/guanine27-N2)-dimethyltransferase